MRLILISLCVLIVFCPYRSWAARGHEVYRQEQMEEINEVGDVRVRVRSRVENVQDTLSQVSFTVAPYAEVLGVYDRRGTAIPFQPQRDGAAILYTFDLTEPVLPHGTFFYETEILNRRGVVQWYGVWRYEGAHRPGPITTLSKIITLPPGAELVEVQPPPFRMGREGNRLWIQFRAHLGRGRHLIWDVRYRVPGTLPAGVDVSPPRDEKAARKSRSYVETGQTQRDTGQWEQAAESFERALEVNPKSVEAAFYLGRICYALGRIEDALKSLQEVLLFQRNTEFEGWVRVTLGWIYDERGDRAAAVEQYEEALALRTSPSVLEAARLGLDHPHTPGKRKPFGTETLWELSPEGWRATSNFVKEEVNHAFDRNPRTRWHTVHAQRPGMFFELSLGQTETVQGVYFDDDGGGTSMYRADYPRMYRIEVSADGTRWKTVAYKEGGMERYAGARFEPVEARLIKITQTGLDEVDGWSIHELYVYGPEGQRAGLDGRKEAIVLEEKK